MIYIYSLSGNSIVEPYLANRLNDLVSYKQMLQEFPTPTSFVLSINQYVKGASPPDIISVSLRTAAWIKYGRSNTMGKAWTQHFIGQSINGHAGAAVRDPPRLPRLLVGQRRIKEADEGCERQPGGVMTLCGARKIIAGL